MGPKKSDKVWKLIPMKVPYEELRPFQCELSELRLEFLFWNWNCVSASICKEIIDKNHTEGVELQGNSMLWTVEHWTKVMGPCAGSDGDLVFEKSSVGLTRTEEFSYKPLFSSGRQGTNRRSRTHARSKKRANRALVAAEVSDSSVEKTVAPIVNTPEVAAGESPPSVGGEGSLGVLIEVPAEALMTPLKEGMEIVSSNSLSSERTQTTESEGIPHSKTSEELDSVVPLLKYLDGKREKYAISKEVGVYVEMIRNRMQLKKAFAVKREWNSATELAREQAAILAIECAAVKVTLQERESQLREKEIECEVLQLNMEKESGRCAELEETYGGLRRSNENGQKMTVYLLARMEKSSEAYDEAVKRSERLITTVERQEKNHVEELAKLEVRRAEEVCIAEELRGKIAEAKTAEEDLCRKVSEIEGKCEAEFQRAEELSASLTEGVRKHEEELANWAKKLTDCESA
ncbi:hypothetical protein AXG93_4201s1360 [Marchantia polymorpha subsp. ruderalis]|uniref:Uncharacterized protein n=1 Tax=Marchantia polymorpha subsp. ruderalis TaxID=1480154 RepID=A0A176WDJ7_MARPO|nr:hypothetical protein AXG93_4201s1360 [Marchantia polymorpha subsp. ruderalis]